MPTAVDQLEAALAAVAEHGERTNAFISIDAEEARAAARAVDEERRRGVDRGPLHGMTISIKDLIDIAGQPTTAASRVRADHIAASDATVITRLRDAGAVIIGKTNLHEFALGPTGDESAYGAVRNPHDTARMAGGSTSGGAAAVAAGMGRAAIGSDTGGSIRIPAAACGVVGLKPSLGEVPTDGVVSLSTTFDHVGPLARTVADVTSVWAVLAGRPTPRVIPPAATAIRLGALGGYFTALLSDEVRAAFDGAMARLRAAGMRIEPRIIEHTDAIVDTYTNISLPEAAYSHAPTIDSRASDYQTGVRDRLERGRGIPAVAYLRAREMRDVLGRAVDDALEGCKALVLPTLPIVAPLIGATDVTFPSGEILPVRMALLRLTQLFNISGNPAITLPIPVAGLPVGLQLVGRRDRTEDLLGVAMTCEQTLNEVFS